MTTITPTTHHTHHTPIAYVSGPITGPTAYHVEQNVRMAEAAYVALTRAGHTAICVHTMSRFMDGIATHAEWMRHDLEILRRCDALVLATQDYQHSRGTLEEIEFATAQGIPVYASVAEFLHAQGMDSQVAA